MKLGKALWTEFGNDILYMTTKAQATKANIDNKDYIKLKHSYSKGSNEKVTFVMGKIIIS